MTLKQKLIHAATQYDIARSRKPGYNIYALAQYFRRIEEVCEWIERGAVPRHAIIRGFNDRLRDVLLKAIGEEKATKDEINS